MFKKRKQILFLTSGVYVLPRVKNITPMSKKKTFEITASSRMSYTLRK